MGHDEKGLVRACGNETTLTTTESPLPCIHMSVLCTTIAANHVPCSSSSASSKSTYRIHDFIVASRALIDS